MVLKSDSQFKKTITYTDLNGKAQKLEATLQEPGVKLTMMLRDMVMSSNDTSDWSSIIETLLDKVIVSPRYTFESLNNDLPDNLKTKEVTKKNADGKEVTLKMKFPDYRTAFGLVNAIVRPSGAANMTDTMDMLDKLVFVDEKDKHIDWDYWDKGGKAYGLVDVAREEANKYLLGVLDKDGLYSLLMWTFQKTQNAVSVKA